MTHEEAVVLLDSLISPFGQRVRIALAEKGVDYEYKVQDLKNKSELLLKSNPVYKQIPVLMHNGNTICQSLIIVQYIDEVWPDKAPLLPTEPYARANARFWADFVDKKVYECGSKLWKRKGEHHETAKEWVEIFKLLECELGDKKYFGDEAFGYIDIALVPFIVLFYAFEQCAKLSMDEECPKIVAWAKRCMEREGVSNALTDPKKIYEMILSQ
ncbi:glutathione S-transferase 3-like [Dioscorea cayenensis subsp. rotundata]|uniref:Probable glutathione S-transferase GSTU1 n=1 Tax=Dioscorea cayennensis subsp. rotundata TaxID=55577 RepID=A0AB40CBV2_DIOCR|nr:glutathione S-transferase 3-like [Dioscorea cayenensis subsp. rotundata]